MTRLSFSLPVELLRQIRRIAAERRVSVSALSREALEEMLTKSEPPKPQEP
jgi:Arc/MetJ-type ribon-helix-helix transcriptional regulator